MALTDVAARKAKPAAKTYKLAAGGGLYLEVTPAGAKYWRMKFRHAGRESRVSFGVYPAVSLAEACAARDTAKKLLKAGKNPVAERKAEKLALVTGAANTFEKVARGWFEVMRNRWTPGHARRVLESLETDIFPLLGARPIATIKAPELLAALKQVEARDALETAARLRQRCRAVFAFGIGSGRCESNPASDLAGQLKTPKAGNYKALARADLPEFLGRLDAYDGSPVTRLALRLLLLTFVRTGELRAAEWAEFDLDGAVWRIPPERMKMRAAHVVPLSRQALEVLAELRQHTGGGRYLFPSQSRRTQEVMSEHTMLYALYRMGYHSRATGHGFRATASTILNEMGFRPDVIERQLAHEERNKVRAAYNRAEYLDERRTMMQTWGEFLDALRTGAKVISLRAA